MLCEGQSIGAVSRLTGARKSTAAGLREAIASKGYLAVGTIG